MHGVQTIKNKIWKNKLLTKVHVTCVYLVLYNIYNILYL